MELQKEQADTESRAAVLISLGKNVGAALKRKWMKCIQSVAENYNDYEN